MKQLHCVAYYITNIFYHQKLNECKDNPKKTWDILRTLLPSKKNSRVPNLIKINSTTTISDVHEITEEFNHHFVNVGKFIANSVQANSTDDEILYLKNACPDSIYLQPTTPYEIMTLINYLKLNKAGGHDDVDPLFFKDCSPYSFLSFVCYAKSLPYIWHISK